jgi:hypothetical protein
LHARFGAEFATALESMELATGASPSFDKEAFLAGKQTPVDLVKAYVWMTLSNKSGNPAAASEAKNLRSKLNPDELLSADSMIQALKKTLP